jgi:hypothetical protein
MTPYSQRDPRWKDQQLGSCNTTIGREGCAITACGILADKSPDYVNNLGDFVSGCLASWERLANDLGLDFDSRRDIPVKYPCIAQVVLSGFQHFIVLKDANTQIDPWTGQEGSLKYNILGYRNLSPKGESMAVSMKDMSRNIVYRTYVAYLGREPENDGVIEAHANWIMADSGDTYNFKGAGEWVAGIAGSDEFKDRWVLRSEVPACPECPTCPEPIVCPEPVVCPECPPSELDSMTPAEIIGYGIRKWWENRKK